MKSDSFQFTMVPPFKVDLSKRKDSWRKWKKEHRREHNNMSLARKVTKKWNLSFEAVQTEMKDVIVQASENATGVKTVAFNLPDVELRPGRPFGRV